MLITKEQDYALRILRSVSRHDRITAMQIAEEENVSRAFVTTIANKLIRAGLLQSKRGKSFGGYRLGKDLKNVSIYDVLVAVNPKFSIAACLCEGETCTQNSGPNSCLIHDSLCRLQQRFFEDLKSEKLQSLFGAK